MYIPNVLCDENSKTRKKKKSIWNTLFERKVPRERFATFDTTCSDRSHGGYCSDPSTRERDSAREIFQKRLRVLFVVAVRTGGSNTSHTKCGRTYSKTRDIFTFQYIVFILRHITMLRLYRGTRERVVSSGKCTYFGFRKR